MRVTFVGASSVAVLACKALCERGHEVILIEEDSDRVETLSEQLDCGLICGDGTRPSILEEVGPQQTDVLFCMSDRDEANILAALVGRSLGFERVVPKVEDPELEPICTELGLDDVIVPDREVATELVDLVEGRDNASLTTVVRSGLRFFSFTLPEGIGDEGGLELPDNVRLIARTRGDASVLVDGNSRFESGDELVLIAEEDAIDALRERFRASDSRRSEEK